MTYLTVQQVNSFLNHLGDGSPTEGESDPFLAQYEQFLSRHLERRQKPGKLLLVLGPGRNGSTSMAHALRRIPNSLVTHERPPLLHWDVAGPRLAFHREFTRISRQYFALVADVSHWWLPHFETMKCGLGDMSVIYLHRDFAATVASFVALKFRVSPPFNHWLPHVANEWNNDSWDECYPNVSDELTVLDQEDEYYKRYVCQYCIAQYVKKYQMDARRLIQTHNGIELSIDTLFTPESARRLSSYVDLQFEWHAVHLNRATTADSAGMTLFEESKYQ